MGLEAIKSSTPNACREKIKQAFKVIIEKDEVAVIKFISDFREEFKTLPIADISFPRGVNGLEKYQDDKSIFGFKTPIHVRGSLIFNHQIVTRGLSKKYQQIKEGEKIKFIYLKQPNTIRSDVISFLSSIPKEFDLEQYIDYDTQFDKSFLEPLKIVLECINWKVEKTNSLEDFFS
jgi:DNA polymerase elongation subunit (family B)